MTLFIILGIILWVLIALWPANLAKSKGYSFLLFLFLSWAFSWLLILIIVMILPNKNADKAQLPPRE